MLGISNSASAWVIGDPLVPCTTNCTKCELLHLVDNLIDFIMIALAPIVATLFFIISGTFIMLGGANPGMLARGKRMFTDTLIGLIIIMLAWLITNTLMTTLVEGFLDLKLKDGVPYIVSVDWWQLTCSTIGF